MHGIIFKQLKAFVVEHHGRDAWTELVEQAETDRQSYLPVGRYPDEELVELVGTASEMTDTPVPALLEAFGESLAGPLLDLYEAQIDTEWGYFDLLEHTEQQIHEAIRLTGDDAPEPPEIAATREAPDRVTIAYGSERQLCGVARGLLAGLADAYGEDVRVDEPACMHDGARECELVVEAS